jgi:hypothetical protein
MIKVKHGTRLASFTSKDLQKVINILALFALSLSSPFLSDSWKENEGSYHSHRAHEMQVLHAQEQN